MARNFYRKNYPNQARELDVGLHNTFVSITHKIGLGKYFSFIPPAFDRDEWRAQHGAGSEKDYDHTKDTPNSQ